MSKALDILHIEDSEDDSLLVRRALRELEFEVDLKRVDTLPALRQALSVNPAAAGEVMSTKGVL